MGKNSCSTCVRNAYCHKEDKFKEGMVYGCHVDVNDWDVGKNNLSPQITRKDLFMAALLVNHEPMEAYQRMQVAESYMLGVRREASLHKSEKD